MGIRVVIDCETNSVINPSKVWCIVCKDLDTGVKHVWRNVKTEDTEPTEEAKRFLRFAEDVTYWVGHSWLEFDYPVLNRLLGLQVPDVFSTDVSLDTLLLSRLVDYSRGRVPVPADSLDADGPERPIIRGHSIESYGAEFGLPKLDHKDFTKYSLEMEQYCERDVDVCHRIYLKYLRVVSDSVWSSSLRLEHSFQSVVNDLHNNGFAFNVTKAKGLLDKVTKELGGIDADITKAFPTKQVLLKEFIPRATIHGTISKTSVPRSLWSRISEFEIGKTYPVYQDRDFNPSSHKQLIEVLHEARWSPIEKTQTHIDLEREINRLKYTHSRPTELDLRIKVCQDRLVHMAKYGWKINENNLSQLPPDAPPSSRLLAKRILLESRRRTLTEWLHLVGDDQRIHGKFYGIGAWTGRMAHQRPNTANIPNEYDTQGKKKLLGKEMRSLWCTTKGRLLVGVDAEAIQLRIFAHLIDDKEFTDALVKGRKEDKTDPHSLNQRILSPVCKTRAAAKRFIYALLLGAGLPKLASILECPEPECREALDRLLRRYTGWERLRTEVFPNDAKRGYLIGLDGRKVVIPGETVSQRKHLAMSGYLQSGEAIVMKRATVKWMQEIDNAVEKAIQGGTTDTPLQTLKQRGQIKIVNFVYDEWQTETPNDMAVALWVAEVQSRSLSAVGEELGLRCPLAGSYWNDDAKDYTIGTNWSVTH